MKQCSTCKEAKSFQEYYTCNYSRDGYKSQCKKCHRVSQKKWNKANTDRVTFLAKRWATHNPIKCREKVKRYQEKNPGLQNERRLLRKVVTGYKVGSKPYSLLGVDRDTAWSHLKDTWKKRYGVPLTSRDTFHIDHIIPCSSARNKSERLKLHHYMNLQLLKPRDNSRKGAKNLKTSIS